MAYCQKLKTAKERNKCYNDEEIMQLRKKYHGHIPFTKTIEEGERVALHIPSKIHKKHELVYYKKDLARIEKVTDKGIYLRLYKQDKKDELIYPVKKLKFVAEKDIEDDVKLAFFENVIPVGVYSPYALAFEKEE